jgi:pyruvate/2-oxoglutarate dehydrogenase complex dihydrolipoamide dehydrogenase (E3) component
MSEVDRAIAAEEILGFVKLVAGPRRLLRNTGGGRVLGATIVASRAGEMIHEPALAMRTGMFAGRLAQTVHAYPTWSVAVRQAAAQLFMETGGRQARAAHR